MNIRYKIKYSGGVATSIYSIKDLEDKDLIHSMYFLDNSNVEIIRRDLGTGLYDEKGVEAFENDKVLLKSGISGIVVMKPGGFFVGKVPLHSERIKTVIKEA